MKDNPRIMVFRLKELIYTGIFIILGILLIILMVYMFSSKGSSDKNASAGELSTTANDFTDSMKTATEVTTPAGTNPGSADEAQASAETTSAAPVPESSSAAANQYIPGVYTSSLMLNNSTLEIQVCVDSNHINSVSINNMDEAITTMYPLMSNSINDISNQIVNSQSLENITYTEDCRYTYIILLDAIATTLEKEKIQPEV